MKYAWIIDIDHIADPDEPEGSFSNAKGVAGPGGATEQEIALAEACGYRFRMKDDDGEVYYTGWLWIDDPELYAGHSGGHPRANAADYPEFKRPVVTNLPEEAFGPLDDFGKGNAGCTSIEFLTEKGWAVL